jgi:alkanesulfonate monooxygenase SsuD/methylene tetrahydromethanopterin reductase-like flavin-dependent oxidoreductase (luciferase family)
VALPHYGDEVSLERMVSIAQECERLGFDSVWVSDHLAFDLAKYGGSDALIGCLDPLVTLSVLARETKSLRLGTMVLCNEFRHPAVLAKQAAAIHLASGGRLELGIGAGWYEREFTMTGIAFPSPRVRLERLAESASILREALTGRATDFAGKHYRLEGFVARPAPDEPPTLWIGGKGDRAIGVAADVGDGWNAAWFQDPEAYEERAAQLGGSKVRRSIGQYAQGSAGEMTDRLAAFATLGVEHTIMCFSSVPFGLDDEDDLARFAQNVLPQALSF